MGEAAPTYYFGVGSGSGRLHTIFILRRRSQLRFNRIGLLLLAGCGSTSPSSHVPDLGRYTFTASWPIAGFNQPATAAGELVILTTGETVTYRFTLTEAGGPVMKEGTASWGEANGYVLTAPTIGRAGAWIMVPHLERDGAGYRCHGNAVNASFQGTPMTCTFAFLGP